MEADPLQVVERPKIHSEKLRWGAGADYFLMAREDFPDSIIGIPVKTLATLWNTEITQDYRPNHTWMPSLAPSAFSSGIEMLQGRLGEDCPTGYLRP